MAVEVTSPIKKLRHVLMILGLLGLWVQAFGASSEPKEAADLFEMSIEELMEVEVVSASR